MRPKSPRRRSRRPAAAAVRPQVGVLEPRRLCAVDPATVASLEQVVGSVGPILARPTDATQSVPIEGIAGDATHPIILTDPNVPGTIVAINTSKGQIVLALTDNTTPQTVANFLAYATAGAYDGTIIHRTVNFAQTAAAQQASPGAAEVGGSPAHPGDVIQGGGFTLAGTKLAPIPTNAPIPDEFDTEAFANYPGTIAVAKPGDQSTGLAAADSATSGWFINNSDNTAAFDTTLQYTAFGHVLQGMDVVNAIASVPTISIDTTTIDPSTNKPVAAGDVPVAGVTQSQITAGYPIGAANLITVNSVTEEAGTQYAATSDLPNLVTPVIDAHGNVTFKYGTIGSGGTATITVTASNVYDGTSASTTFALTVPPASSTAAGPITAPDAVDDAVSGAGKSFQPLTNDTDAAAGLNVASVAVAAQPAHGTATVDPATGRITYTATAGYTGTDTLTYTVADANGAVSAPTTVTLNVIPAPLAVTVGAGSKVKQLLFTQPDGARGRFTIAGGSAVVTFSPGTVTTAVGGGTETVTGTGATISGVAVTNGSALPTVTLAKVGGAGTVTLGGLTDTAAMTSLNLPTATLAGTVDVGGLTKLTAAGATGATVKVGVLSAATVATVGTAADSSLIVTNALTSLTSRSWTVSDGASHVVQAATVGKLAVTGMFADRLVVTSGAGYVLTSATVGGASAPWQVNGSVFRATVTAPTADWSLTDGALIQTLTVRGNLAGTSSANTVSAATINNMTVTGAMTDASVVTTGTFNQRATQLNRLAVGGAMTDSVVFTVGNVNAITARSMSGSRVYAGVLQSVAAAAGLPAGTTDLAFESTVNAVTVRTTFANSVVAAYKLSRVGLGAVTAANGGTAFGVSAHTVGSLSATLVPGGHLGLSGADLRTAATLSATLARRKVTLTDFKITLY